MAEQVKKIKLCFHCRPYVSWNSGFTLLEVLVALIIIGISLGAVFQAFSQSKQIAWKSDEKMECARIAQNILSNSAIIHGALREDEREGVLEEENGWRYMITVQPLEFGFPNEASSIEIPAMVKLKLLLIHNNGQGEKTFELNRWYRR